MNQPMPAAPVPVAPMPVVPRQKIRPFSFVWGVLFFTIGVSGFAVDALGATLGSALSFSFLFISCTVMYLIVLRRRQADAAQEAAMSYANGVSTPAGPTIAVPATATATAVDSTQSTGMSTVPTPPQNPLYAEALAELDAIDHTVADPERVLDTSAVDDDTSDSNESSEATGSEGHG